MFMVLKHSVNSPQISNEQQELLPAARGNLLPLVASCCLIDLSTANVVHKIVHPIVFPNFNFFPVQTFCTGSLPDQLFAHKKNPTALGKHSLIPQRRCVFCFALFICRFLCCGRTAAAVVTDSLVCLDNRISACGHRDCG